MKLRRHKAGELLTKEEGAQERSFCGQCDIKRRLPDFYCHDNNLKNYNFVYSRNH